jgi:hypothetical protein
MAAGRRARLARKQEVGLTTLAGKVTFLFRRSTSKSGNETLAPLGVMQSPSPVGLAANVRVSGTGYKSRPSGRLGAEFVSLFRNTWLPSLRASLFFRSRWKRVYLHCVPT